MHTHNFVLLNLIQIIRLILYVEQMENRLELIAWVNFLCWIILSVALAFKLSVEVSVVLVAVCVVSLGYNMYNLVCTNRRVGAEDKNKYKKRVIRLMLNSLGIMVICMIDILVRIWKID